ncbi:MAG: nucleotidyltransferase domain-containing protein [Candidatus Nanohaloarchaea archaeon]|nr:nucleotidyltransferase domain-containing protein [Candidatus Nanohaloarchaea archaeon]
MYFIEVNASSPYCSPLKNILEVDSQPLKEAAEGVADDIMEEYADGIVSIYLFGSVARGTPRIDSDIDILIVYKENRLGEEERQRIVDSVRRQEDKLKIHIQLLWYSKEEWERDLRRGISINERIVEEGIRLEGEELGA